MALSRRQRFISGLILAHVLLIPVGSEWARRRESAWAQRGVAKYLVWSGLAQRWALFAPEPRHYRARYYARVRFRDGSERFWAPPNAPRIGFAERHLAHAYQKYAYSMDYLEQKGPDGKGVLWLDLARFLERMHRDAGNPPLRISWYRSVADLPEASAAAAMRPDPGSLAWKEELYFTYDVERGRLL
jgi:hypothetical protein